MLLAIFAVHGIPEEVVGDNMPFNSREFRQFAKDYNFVMTTSSCTHSQSNGKAERNVQIVKRMLKKAYEDGKDESLALLEFRNTPVTGCDYSPAELLFSRKLRDKLPVKSSSLDPKIPINAREQLLKCQEKQKFYYDKGAKPLKPLESGDTIRYYKEKTWEPAIVVNRHDAPKSYNIEAESGSKLRRNRVHLRKTLENRPNIETEIDYDNLITSSHK